MPRAAILIASLAVASCGFTPPRSPERLDALAGCRAEANRIYSAQNRDQLSERDESASPFAANTLPSDPNRGLADRYRYEQLEDDCLAGRTATIPASTGSSAAPAAAAPPAGTGAQP